MKVGKKLLILILIIFAFSSLSYAEKERKSEKKGRMPVASESSGDAKEMVKHKNSLQEAEKEQSETEEGNEEKADSEKEQSKDEDEEGKAREDEESTLKIQGFEENAHQIQTWLEDLLGRPLNLNNPKDKAIYEFWCGLLEQGYTLDQVHSLIDTVALAKKTIDFWYNGSFYQMGKVDLNDVKDHRALFNWASLILQGFSPQDVRLLIILTRTFRNEIKDNMLHRNLNVTKLKDVKIIAGWSLYRRQGYSASGVYTLFKNRLLPEIEKLIPNFNLSNPAHAGFFTYWCEKALVRLSGGLDYVSNFLNAMAQIKGEVEDLIGEVDFLDNNYQDNGFITYWAEQALKKGINYIKQHLYIWKRLIPAIEQKLDRKLDLFNSDDTGIVDYWANKVEDLMEEEGLELEEAIQRVIEMILEPEPTIYEELIPYIEQLLGVPFDENNPQHMGFLTYWSQRAEEEGLENIENLLQAMIDIKDEVETLIGEINFLDDDASDDGFITYWAQKALQEGTNNVKQLLQAMIAILPEVEALIGEIDFLDEDYKPEGVLSFWAQKAIREGIEETKDLLQTMNQLLPLVENLVGEIDFFDEDAHQEGFLSYWAERAQREGLENIQALLETMIAIKPEVEGLIGEINFLDDDASDDGFITNWAERALRDGLDIIKMLLSDMGSLKPLIERGIGRVLNLFDPDDSGLLSYWANEVQRLMQEEGLSHEEALARVEEIIRQTYNIEGNITFYMNDDEVVFFDKDGNILFRYQLPDDLDHTEYRPLYVLISPDDRHAVIIWEKIEHTSQINPNHPDRHYFYYTKIVFGDNPKVDVVMGNFYGQVNHALMTPDGNYLMIGFSDDSLPDKVMFINLTNNSQIATTPIQGGPGRIVDMISAPDSRRMYLISDNACVTIFDPQTGEVLATIETPWYYTSNWEGKLYISDDGNILTIVDKDGNEVKYDVSDLDNIHQIEEIPPEILEALIPYVEQLLGEPFDENNPQHQGFLTYWGQRAVEEGLENIENLLQAMIDIKPEVETLIGEINFLDDDASDDGFITYWAEQALEKGTDTVKMLLSDMAYLKPLIERGIGRTLDVFDPDDSGLLSYWANEVQRLMEEEGLSHEEALARVEEIIRQTYNIEGNITFYMNDDEVVFFDEDGNVLYTYTLPEDDPDGHYTYKPEFVLISPDDSFAVVIWGLTHYPLEPHHGPSAYFGGVKITFNNTSETELEFRENAGWVNEVAMTDDGTLMIAYRPLRRLPGQIIFYDLNTNSEIANTPLQGGPEIAVDMILSPDDSRLYVLSDHAFVTIFDPQTGEVLATIETPWYYTFNWEGKLYISDDGNILTIVDKDGNEVKYDVSDLDNIHQIEEIPDEIRQALIPYVEQLLGVPFDENNPQHQGFLTYWGQRAVEEGLENIENLLQAMIDIKTEVEALIGQINFLDDNPADDGFITYWAQRALQEGTDNIKALLQAMASIFPEIEALIGDVNLLDENPTDDGFLTYWAQKAIQDGIDNVKALLQAMKNILPEVEDLIGTVNLLDNNPQDDGFLTYWAQQAVGKSIEYIKQHLYIWKRLIPAIEQKLGRELDLFNSEDTGIVDFWANKVEELMAEEGLDLEEAIQKVIDMILQEEPTIYEELIPYIEQLLGEPFDENNPQYMGFLTYWSQRAEEEGLENIQNLLQAMIDIKDEVEALIGSINFLDEDASDDGFITYWAERALQEGLDTVKALLQAMNDILPEVESLIGTVNLLDANPADDGFLTYWAEQVLERDIETVQTLLDYMAQIRPHLENLVGEIDLLDNSYEDNGLLTFWAEYAQQNGLQTAINIVDNMVQLKDEVEALIGPVDLYDHQYGDNGFLTYWAEYALDVGTDTVEELLNYMAEIRSEVEALIGEIDFLDNNYNDNGFITYWAEYARENGLQKTKDILSNMAAILNNDWDENGISEIEELIGEINFFDNNYDDNGFLTYWAEQALTRGVGEINMTLYIWKRLLPYVEEHEGRKLDLFNPDDSGIVSYWEGEVRRLMQEEGLELEEAIQRVIDTLSGGTSIASFLYDTSEKVLNFFKDNVGIDSETGLPYSFITTTKDGLIRHNFFEQKFTALSDIAMEIVSLISLQKIGKIGQEELEANIAQILNSIQSLPTYSPQTGEFQDKIYFFNYYTLPDKEVAFGNFISAVDNANMVMALILAREACPQYAQEINDLIDKIDLKFFYDPSAHLFMGGYYYDTQSGDITPADFHYGMLNTETRLISYLAIGKGDLSDDEANLHWQALVRTIKNVYGIDVLASYGGSLFEALFPSLFVDEARLSQNGLGLNFKKMVLIQKLQAIENGLPFWGESPSYDEIYEYSEFGSEAGVNPYQSQKIISPYSVFLALNAVSEGGQLLQLLETLYPGSVQSETGIVDAIDLNNDLPVYLKSALVQGIVLASIANSLNGSIRNLFMQTEEAQRIIPFIQSENYFSKESINQELNTVKEMIQTAINQNQWQKAKALFDYFKDLIITYNKQSQFPNLNEMENTINNLVEQNLAQLYQKAQNEINNQNFTQAIKDLLTILYYQPDNQDAFNLLDLARQLRAGEVVLPQVTYLITDFEEGCRPNQYVSKIGPVENPNGNIDIKILENEPQHGKIMKLEYELQPEGFNGIYINLENLTISRSGKLVLDIKGDEATGIPDKVKIELHFKGSSWPYPAIEISDISPDWKHLEIDLSQFLPQLPEEFELEQIAIIFEGDKVGNNQGAIYIDNIGFK